MEHALNRALERYGLKLSYSDLVEIAMKCREGYGRLSYQGGRREQHLIEYNGRALVVIYEAPGPRSKSEYGTIVTVLPREAALAPKRNNGLARRHRENRTRHA